MTSVQIPASLRREIAEHPERFRPAVKKAQLVVALGRANDSLPIGDVVTADFDFSPSDAVLSTSRPGSEEWGIAATTWAVVVDSANTELPPSTRLLMIGGELDGTIQTTARTSEKQTDGSTRMYLSMSVPAEMVAILPPAPEPEALQALHRAARPQVPDRLTGVTSWFAAQAAAGRAAGESPRSRLPALLESHEGPAAIATTLDQSERTAQAIQGIDQAIAGLRRARSLLDPREPDEMADAWEELAKVEAEGLAEVQKITVERDRERAGLRLAQRTIAEQHLSASYLRHVLEQVVDGSGPARVVQVAAATVLEQDDIVRQHLDDPWSIRQDQELGVVMIAGQAPEVIDQREDADRVSRIAQRPVQVRDTVTVLGPWREVEGGEERG